MYRISIATLAILLAANIAIAQPVNSSNQYPEQNYFLDENWGNPPGGGWGGNTMWVAADGKGQIYVLVRAVPHVRIFDRDGNFIRAWNGEGQIENPHSITIDDEGNAWITETYSHIVVKFSNDGKHLMTLGKRDEPGDNDIKDRFSQPNHVFIDDNGDIYVSDGYVNSRIIHFTPEGEFIRIIGGVGGPRDGEFQAVHGVAVDSKGNIIANDSENFRVNVFNKDGQFIESWPYQSRGGLEITDDDTVYISDINLGEVYILKNGELIDTAYAPRSHGLAVDSDGAIYTSSASRLTVNKLTPK